MIKKKHFIFLLIIAICISCEYRLQPSDEGDDSIKIVRYDRIQYHYLTTGDFSALQQMEMDYPMETRTLIEKMLELGYMNHPDINKKFLIYFQDSTLQSLMSDVQAEFANVDDLNKEFNVVFDELCKMIPELLKPKVYTQVGALTQSIIIGDQTIGISLDKYMGEDYPLYERYYSKEQRKMMSREYIVPDGLSFYLLSLYPAKGYEIRSQTERDLHVGAIMWVCNKALRRKFFKTRFVDIIEQYMRKHKNVTPIELLDIDDYSVFGGM